MKSAVTNPANVFTINLVILLVLGGLGIAREAVLLLGLINTAVLCVYVYVNKKEIETPKLFLEYCLFLLVLAIHTIFSGGRLYFVLLFVSGGLFWLVFYNLSDIFRSKFLFLITLTGIIMGAIFLYFRWIGIEVSNFESIYSSVTASTRHSHIGDLWAIVVIGIFYKIIKKPQIWHWIVLIAAFYFLITSFSRSAYLALFAGILVIFANLEFRRDVMIKRLFSFLILSIITIFIVSGFGKTTMLSRPYYIQAAVGLFEHPLGVGVGNFIKVSQEVGVGYLAVNATSIFAHNLVLEVMAGMGVFSIVFIWWLVRVLYELFTNKDLHHLYLAIFVTILVNFSFDITYGIPTFFWLWFMSLALAQKVRNPGKSNS